MSDRTPRFAGIVRSHPAVRDALACYPPARLWWMLLLGLHGPAVPGADSPEQAARVVADGFRLYARLYRIVSAGLLCLALAARAVAPGTAAGDWLSAGAFLAAAYLWFASGLGLAGASEYGRDRAAGGLALAFFVVMIVVFLTALAAVASFWVQGRGLLHPWLTLALAFALVAVGGGSYGLELAYLYAVGGAKGETGK